jgi:hypothetical protein
MACHKSISIGRNTGSDFLLYSKVGSLFSYEINDCFERIVIICFVANGSLNPYENQMNFDIRNSEEALDHKSGLPDPV